MKGAAMSELYKAMKRIEDYQSTKPLYKQIAESATRMEFIWQNRDSFKDNIDIEVALENALKNIERQIEEFKGYLKPFDKEDNQ